jgi:hypothetical protein
MSRLALGPAVVSFDHHTRFESLEPSGHFRIVRVARRLDFGGPES